MLMLQHLLMTHGDHVLQIIKHLSQQLNLSLDGEASIQTATTRKVYPVPSLHRKLTPAKFEAWQMWHEDGLSVQKIAVCFFIFIYFLYFFNSILFSSSTCFNLCVNLFLNIRTILLDHLL